VIRQTDVLVIGAGPAGASAAAALTGRGLSVVLAGGATSDHEVLISGQALRALASLRLPSTPFLRPVTSLRLSFGPSASQELTDSGAAVASRQRLCDALRYAAISHGADHIPGQVAGLQATGSGHRAIVFAPGSGPREVSARQVVMATGSEGWPARDQPGTAPLAGIACARRFDGLRLRDTALLTLIVPDGARVSAPPRCVWAIPGTGATITIGTAIVGADDSTSLPPTFLIRLSPASQPPTSGSPRSARPVRWSPACLMWASPLSG
jgi:menaquinone-9 beta-reductase